MKTSKPTIFLAIGAFLALGAIAVITVSALSNSVSIEPVSANTVEDSEASDNSFVLFGDSGGQATPDGRVPILFDCDCVNEVDDQFALAYTLVNDDVFDVRGVTTNDTGRVLTGTQNVARHTQEAQFIVDLVYGPGNGPPVISGAPQAVTYGNTIGNINGNFNGVEAVDFIIDEAKKYSPNNKLTVVTVGKVTNAALALARDPSIADKVRVFSLGGNYPLSPDPESNIFQDPPGLNALLDGEAEFELFSNNFTKAGAAKITLNRNEIEANLRGLGPQQAIGVPSPYGQSFTNVGDFLFFLADRFFAAGERPMYDTAPIAILLDETLGVGRTIPSPRYSVTGGGIAQRTWVNRPDNPRSIVYWEDFRLNDIPQSIFDSFSANDTIPTYNP